MELHQHHSLPTVNLKPRQPLLQAMEHQEMVIDPLDHLSLVLLRDMGHHQLLQPVTDIIHLLQVESDHLPQSCLVCQHFHHRYKLRSLVCPRIKR